MQDDYIIKKLDAAFCERSVVLPNLWMTFTRILLKYHQFGFITCTQINKNKLQAGDKPPKIETQRRLSLI